MGKSEKPVQLNLDREPFERQSRETDVAWQAFLHYRDSDRRSTSKTAESIRKSTAMVQQWSRRWRWLERTVAWDNHLDARYRAEREKCQVEMAKTHIKLAKAIQGKIASRLVNLEADEIGVSEIARLLDVAVKIERLAMGAPTEHTQQELTGKVTIAHEYTLAKRIFDDPEARKMYLALMARIYMV